MRVLITGVAGFLGSHLADRFLAEGYHVVGVDNLVTGSPDNLSHLERESRFHLIEHDVSAPLFVDEELDGVLHFASPASPPDYLDLPIQTLKAGGLGTYHTLGLALRHGARYLLASTSEVYGDPQVHPQREDYWGHVNPVGPRGVYDEAKRYAEAMTMAYHRAHRLDTRIVRIFNTYGSRMRPDDGRVVSNFIVQGLRGEPMTVYGDGSQTRSFCFVDDCVDGIFRLFRSARVEPTNIGNPEEVTVLELARMVTEEVGCAESPVFLRLPADDPGVRCPDITAARRHLGWSPRVGLREGLRKTVRYFSNLKRRTARCMGALVLLAAGCGADPGEEAALMRGDRAFAHGEYEEALAEYRLALLTGGSGADGVVRAAHAYVALGRVDDARSLYEQAVAEDDAHADQAVSDFVALARREHDSGDSYGMASAMEAALHFRPGLVVEGLALPMARHYSNSGEYGRARPLYLRALGQNRGDADIVFETALAHEEIGDCERALVYLDEFVQLAPRRAAEVGWHVGSCSFQLSRELADEGALDEALRYLDEMIELAEPRPLLAQAYMDRGEILAQLGDCLAAVDAFRAVVEVDPSGSGPLVGHARARVDEIRFGERGDALC